MASAILSRISSHPKEMIRLTGPAGSGKSWVAERVSRIWRRNGGSVLLAVGDDAAAGRPLNPFLIALINQAPDWRAILRGSARGAIAATEKAVGSPGAGASLFDLLTASLDQRFERATRPLSGAERGILQDLRRQAKRAPVLIIADNAHWWDAGSIALLSTFTAPALRKAVPELGRVSVLLVDTLEDQGAVDEAGYRKLLKKASAPHHVLPQLSRAQFPTALRALGLTKTLPQDMLDLLYTATGAHLKLCQQLVAVIETGGAVDVEIGDDLVTQALTARFEGFGPEAARVADLLSNAALIGLRFNLAQLACLTSAPVEDIRRVLGQAQAASLVQLDADAGTFTHDLLRGHFHQRLGGEARGGRYGQLAKCLALVRPAEYELRARLLQEAGQMDAARDAWALALVRRLRDGAPLARVEIEAQALYPNDDAFLAFVRDMAQAWRFIAVGDYAKALRLTAATAPSDTELMAAERAYAAALCWMEQETREGFVESRLLLEEWRGRLTHEPEMHIRFGLLLQQALILAEEFDAARAVEKALFVTLSQRASVDDDAARLLQVQNRRAAGINASEIAEARIQRAVVFFAARDQPVDHYKALTNHAAILLAMGRDEEAVEAAGRAEAVVLANSELNFPRKDVLGHNLAVAAYRGGGHGGLALAITRQRQVVDSIDGRADNFLQRCALAGFALLADDLELADQMATALEAEIAIKGIAESYLLYYAAGVREALCVRRQDWAGARNQLAATQALVDGLKWTAAPFVRRRHARLSQLVAEQPYDLGTGEDFDQALIRRSPIEIGNGWSHYGRMAPMCDLSFWSDS